MSHWAVQYLGRPWIAGARGPDAFDCWGLVRWCSKEHFGRELPEYPSEALLAGGVEAVAGKIAQEAANPLWLSTPLPSDGTIVAMGRSKIFHVGLWLEVDGGLVLHCRERANVICESLPDIKRQGMRIIRFYELRS